VTTKQDLARMVHELNEIARKRPDLGLVCSNLVANRGVRSLAELAELNADELEAIYDALTFLEEEVGDGDPFAENISNPEPGPIVNDG
jgi:hypothetical protein